MAKSVKLSKLIADQIPGHVRSNHDTFVTFLEYYYEWLEQKYGPVDTIRNWDFYSSIDTDVDEFVEEFKSEVLSSFPVSTLADKKRLILHARDFLNSKGTAKSFKFLFRVLFNEDVEIHLPKENLFRLSNGNWVKNDNVLVTSSINDPSLFLYKRIRQTRGINEFVTEEASALVIKVERYRKDKIVHNRLFLDDIRGEFDNAHTVYLDGDDTTFEYIYPIVSRISIDARGIGYRKGDRIQIDSSAPLWVVSGTLNAEKVFDTKATTLLAADEITVKVNTVETVDFTFDGRFVDLSNHQEGDAIEVVIPSTAGYIEVAVVDAPGEIEETRIFDFPIGYTSEPNFTILSSTGSGASLSTVIGAMGYIPGYYLGSDGMPSSTNFLQDSNYYQEYSYVIRASRSVDTYANIVKRLLHPAGMKMFGEINILSILSLIIRDLRSYVEIEVPAKNFLIETDMALHSRVSSFDKAKFTYDSLNIHAYEDLVLGNFFNFFHSKWDFSNPTIVEILDQEMVDLLTLYGAEDVWTAAIIAAEGADTYEGIVT